MDKTFLWHCRLGHINKKCIAKLQLLGALESFDVSSFDECKSCLLGKMTKAPFTGNCELSKGLLDLIHTDVCGPFSKYGYVYLIKHKSETFRVFRTYQNEVQNQLGKSIKILRSDRGGEYKVGNFATIVEIVGLSHN